VWRWHGGSWWSGVQGCVGCVWWYRAFVVVPGVGGKGGKQHGEKQALGSVLSEVSWSSSDSAAFAEALSGCSWGAV